MRLFSYIVAHDSGFAPCVTANMCTLACCKPKIRKNAHEGDWVLGTTPKKHGPCRLVYLMRVDSALKFADYYRDRRLRRRADNIYYPLSDGRYEQKQNPWHKHAHKKKDTSLDRVLLSREFVYLGGKAVDIPPTYKTFVHTRQGHRVFGKRPLELEKIVSFRKWAFSPGTGRLGKPIEKPHAHKDCI